MENVLGGFISLDAVVGAESVRLLLRSAATITKATKQLVSRLKYLEEFKLIFSLRTPIHSFDSVFSFTTYDLGGLERMNISSAAHQIFLNVVPQFSRSMLSLGLWPFCQEQPIFSLLFERIQRSE
jgi:hypothetical protein